MTIFQNQIRQKSVCAFTQGIYQPSSRFRWRQYVPFLIESGITPYEKYSYWGSYPPNSAISRYPWLLATTLSAIANAMISSCYDLRFLQREMTSTLFTGELLLKTPYVFDVDDAIFLNQRFSSVDKIAKRAKLTICGNEFLANYFSRFGDVKVLSTAVNTERFVPSTFKKSLRIIGWSGSSSGLNDLYSIESALMVILKKYPDVCLKVISDRPPRFNTLPEKQLIFQQWALNIEVEAIQDISIGIMPLIDRIWNKGKCSYKMLTYMSVELPVVASAIGMNIDVMKHGNAGFLVKTLDEWVDALSFLLDNQDPATKMGKIGRRIVKRNYSTNIIGPELAKILKEQC